MFTEHPAHVKILESHDIYIYVQELCSMHVHTCTLFARDHCCKGLSIANGYYDRAPSTGS